MVPPAHREPRLIGRTPAPRSSDAIRRQEPTEEYLAYLRLDVQITYECSVELRRRYDGYELPKPL